LAEEINKREMTENAEIVIAFEYAGITIYAVWAVTTDFITKIFRDYIFLSMQLLYSVLTDAKTAIDAKLIRLL
jgi:hypothetical protein